METVKDMGFLSSSLEAMAVAHRQKTPPAVAARVFTEML